MKIKQMIIVKKVVLFLVVFSFSLSSTVKAEKVKMNETVSQVYFYGMMMKAKSFRIKVNDAENYLQGLWQLDKDAHVGGSHYTRSDRGDDVTLIINNKRSIQIDFNPKLGKFHETTDQLTDLKVNKDGMLSLNEKKKCIYQPIDENHMAVVGYDSIVVLKRISARTKKPVESDKEVKDDK